MESGPNAAPSQLKGKPTIKLDVDRLSPKERIGLFSCVTFIIGGVIGSGIFVSPQGAFVHSGSVGLTLIVWLVVGMFAMMLSFVYADLGTMIPRSGGPYMYVLNGIGDIPAFLISWTMGLVGGPAARCVLALVFADYLCSPIFGSCKPPTYLRKIIAATELITLCITNVISVRIAATTQALFTVAKVLVLAVIIVIAFVWMGKGNVEHLQTGFEGSTSSVSSMALAVYACSFAYGGYFAVNEISEEVIKPRKNIPRALIISLTTVIVVYLAANVSYFAFLSKEEIIRSSAVAFSAAEKILGSSAIVVPIGVIFSVYGAGNGSSFTQSRAAFAVARQGHLPEVLCYLHVRTLIPVVNILLSTFISLLLLIPGDISQLINLVSFFGFIVEGTVMISHIRLRVLNKRKSSFPVPIFVSGLAFVYNVFMVVVPLVKDPKIEFLYGVAFLASGILIYIPFVYFKLKIPGFDAFTLLCQLLLEVGPTVIPDKL